MVIGYNTDLSKVDRECISQSLTYLLSYQCMLEQVAISRNYEKELAGDIGKSERELLQKYPHAVKIAESSCEYYLYELHVEVEAGEIHFCFNEEKCVDTYFFSNQYERIKKLFEWLYIRSR